MRHESRDSQLVAKKWHGIWKWVSIGSAVLAAANLFLATGAIWYHAKAEDEHQSEVDDIDELEAWAMAEQAAAGSHPDDDSYVVIDLDKVTDIH